ncbi:hypothetical protein D5085_06695 [Ectothiorhodospiraceae bacterium BW-2]|nr:hypothetical protein D5085_06695 [Ectothiorhodospiraceae bacterium BW-2]
MAKLQQLNVRYDPTEDRLLVTLRDSDLSDIYLYFTRRFSQLLMRVLEQVTRKNLAREYRPAEGELEGGQLAQALPGIAQFERQQALQQLDFSTPTAAHTPPAATPLGKSPLLANRIDYHLQSSGALQLTVVTIKQQSINMSLDQKMIFGLQKLLHDGITRAEWNLSTAVNHAEKEVTEPSRLLH